MFPMPDRIRQGRVAARLSQAEFALQVGVCRSAVAQWERLEGTSPSVAHLERIATTLDVAFEWLATGRGAMRMPAATEPAPLLAAAEFTRDDLEARLLESIRRLPPRHRAMACRIVESMRR